VSIALFGAALIIARKLSEPVHAHREPRRHDLLVPLKALRGLAARPHKDPLLLLGGTLCFQLAINGALPYFTLYVRELFSLTPAARYRVDGETTGIALADARSLALDCPKGQGRIALCSRKVHHHALVGAVATQAMHRAVPESQRSVSAATDNDTLIGAWDDAQHISAMVLLQRYPASSLFVIGGTALRPLFVGIHNAWDAAT
jgi:hypothetical protein